MAEREPDFFSDPEVIDDPQGYFKQLRSRCPVAMEQYHGSVMVTGYDQAVEVLTRKDETYSSVVSAVGPRPPLPFVPIGDDIREQLNAVRDHLPWSAHLVCFDGKKHVDHRAFVTSLLTYTRVKQNEEYLSKLADRLLDGFIARGHCEVLGEYAHATTTYAISDLLGIPEGDRAELLRLIGAPPSQIGGDAEHKIGADPLIFLKERFDGYISERLKHPRDDLMSELVHARYKDGSSIAPDMSSLLARFLFGAGQDTTSRLITMAVKVLGENPELQQRLSREPQRIPDFLEEVLRFDGPVKVIYRLAQLKTELAGIPIPAGAVVDVCLSGANLDAAHFAAPEEFNIDRPRLRDHLAFSRGVHACPGAPLARMEARIAIERLLARMCNIKISESHHGPSEARRYRYEPTYSFRSLADLHIEFTPV
jgi:cytochrome P450